MGKSIGNNYYYGSSWNAVYNCRFGQWKCAEVEMNELPETEAGYETGHQYDHQHNAQGGDQTVVFGS